LEPDRETLQAAFRREAESLLRHCIAIGVASGAVVGQVRFQKAGGDGPY